MSSQTNQKLLRGNGCVLSQKTDRAQTIDVQRCSCASSQSFGILLETRFCDFPERSCGLKTKVGFSSSVRGDCQQHGNRGLFSKFSQTTNRQNHVPTLRSRGLQSHLPHRPRRIIVPCSKCRFNKLTNFRPGGLRNLKQLLAGFAGVENDQSSGRCKPGRRMR